MNIIKNITTISKNTNFFSLSNILETIRKSIKEEDKYLTFI